MKQAASIPMFKTAFRLEKEAKELKIYNEYNALMAVAGQSKTGVTDFLMRKYGIHSASTIYNIRERVAQRLAEEGQS